MKTIDEMIEVMQAFADGKQIESRSYYGEEWFDCYTPTWDWMDKDYRVKPEPPKKKIIPYGSAEEFIAAQKEHGPYLRLVDYKESYYMPLSVVDIGVEMCDSESYEYEELSKHLIWQDKTPCGKEVEE